jgi:NAD(P)-dependent dehydrogenase (short-subunit alcohol dehydrogenase family)
VNITKGNVAFVTGGASGIGLGIAEAFVREGVRVAIADVDAAALDTALTRLRDQGGEAIAIPCDVADEASVQAAADRVLDAYGEVQIVVSNAGVNPLGRIADIRAADWRWTFDVNVMGMVHGVSVFLPILERQGKGGHFVHTCSAAGLALPGGRNGAFGPYGPSKYATIALSEKLAVEVSPLGIGVTMLCPSFVRTNLTENGRKRPDSYVGEAGGPTDDERKFHRALLDGGSDPLVIGEAVVKAIRDNRLYLIPHPEVRDVVETRFRAILAAFD